MNEKKSAEGTCCAVGIGYRIYDNAGTVDNG